jgi:DNA polymerase-4
MEKYHHPFEWTIALREEIMTQTGLPISFGLAANKMVAKMATDEAKPNGYLHIPSGMERSFLAPLKVNKIPGVGDQLFQTLTSWGIQTIGDLAAWPAEVLEARLGKYGLELWHKAQGNHSGEVVPYHEAKSISTESTFEQNIVDEEAMLAEIVQMTEKVAYSLRQENKMAGCIAVKIRYPDFETTSRQTIIDYTCHDDELIPQAKELFRKLHRKGVAVRLLGVRLGELTDGAVQTNLFADTAKKLELYRAIDEVKDRYGKEALTKATGVRSA